VDTVSVGKRQMRRLGVRVCAIWGDGIKIVHNGNGCEGARWVELAQNRVYWWAFVTVIIIRIRESAHSSRYFNILCMGPLFYGEFC
jgi:hypothetical protein